MEIQNRQYVYVVKKKMKSTEDGPRLLDKNITSIFSIFTYEDSLKNSTAKSVIES